MPKEKRDFVSGEIYHLVLRRAGNELLFGDIDDYYRGIFYIYECNDTNPVKIKERREARARFKKMLKSIEAEESQLMFKNPSNALVWEDKRDKLVEVLAFCLMPNHIHLLVRQLKDGGISRFVQKIASGYACYFKRKYEIKLAGHFFQDRFNSVHIKDDDQLRVVFTYIHTNPTLLLEPEWKEKGVQNPEKTIEFLNNYKWSSYQDYLEIKNFPSLTERTFLTEIMGGKNGCQEWVNNWIEYKGEIREAMKKFSHLSLDK
jgi:putative transposase